VTTRKRYSLADVRRSYTADKANAERQSDLFAHLVYRPLSFPVTWLLLRLGVPAMAVTAGSGMIAVALPILAADGGELAYAWIAGLGLAFHVLDCVDGNLARTTGRASRFGALLDGLCDHVFWAALLVSVGMLVERAGRGAIAELGTELGLACGVVLLLGRDVRQHYALLSGEPAIYGDVAAQTGPSPRQWLLYGVSGLENTYVFGVAIGGALEVLHHVLLAIAGYVLSVALVSIVVALRQALQRDRQAATALQRDSASRSDDSTASKLP
jgi:phosphatidylglycerophosphate synthase